MFSLLGALLARYENCGTDRCFSFPIMMPATKSSLQPQPLAGTLTHPVSNDRASQRYNTMDIRM